MGEKTSQANLCLCDGFAVVAVGWHCRFGTCADRQSSNSRHECHCQYGTALHWLHAIQANKNVHWQKLLELTSQGQAVREELDSMIAIPHKSHADSMRIIQCYGQLEHIVKSLKNNDNP